MTRATRFLLAAVLVAVLAGCSGFTRLAYNNLPTLYGNAAPMLAWMVDDYVDVSGDQKEWVRERLDRALAWHRREELPEYRRFLERIDQRFEGGFTSAEVRDSWVEMRAHFRRAMERLLPDTADFMLQLDAEQVAQLERKFEGDNRKYVKESTRGNAEERMRERARKLVTHLEEWTGKLDDAQRERVEASLRALVDVTAERASERRFRQAETLALLRSKPSREHMIAGLRRLLIDAEAWRSPDYQKKLAARDRVTFEMVASLSTALTPEQRQHLSGRVRGYIRDLTMLSASR